MPTNVDPVAWARAHATDLRADMRIVRGQYSGQWWEATGPESEDKVRARAITALDFLDRYAGTHSQWAIRGHDLFDKQGQTIASVAHALSEVLIAWANQVEAGIVAVPQVQALGARTVASTDLMDQVRLLVDDKNVHPAAPIVLAGAALEIALRSAIDELGLPQPEKHSIDAYSGCLRSAQLLSKQDVKDLAQMAGIRNSAAHGDFDALSRERAGLMEQQVNLFLRNLTDLLASAAAAPPMP